MTAEVIGEPALICVNKIDLLSPEASPAFLQRFDHYERIGYLLALVCAKHNHGLDPLIEQLTNEPASRCESRE